MDVPSFNIGSDLSAAGLEGADGPQHEHWDKIDAYFDLVVMAKQAQETAEDPAAQLMETQAEAWRLKGLLAEHARSGTAGADLEGAEIPLQDNLGVPEHSQANAVA